MQTYTQTDTPKHNTCIASTAGVWVGKRIIISMTSVCYDRLHLRNFV